MTEKAKPPALPSIVQVGPFRYTVECDEPSMNRAIVEEKQGLFGRADHKTLRIVIHPDMAADMLAETLLHELVHAVFASVGLDLRLSETEEDVVRSFAPLLLDTLRRNPQLVAYLTAEVV